MLASSLLSQSKTKLTLDAKKSILTGVKKRLDNSFYFFQEDTVTNPAIWLFLSMVPIFLSCGGNTFKSFKSDLRESKKS